MFNIEMETMESELKLIKKKDKLTNCRCILNCRNKEITLFESDKNRLLAKFNLLECEKFSKYNDMSWELTYKPNKVYRLVSENQMENLKWFNTINEMFTRIEDNNYCNHDDNLSNLDEDETISNVSNYDKDLSNEIYEVIIDPKMTDPHFFTELSLSSTYLITIDENGISLQDKNNGNMHAYETNIIKRYGSTKYGFSFELGANLDSGHGLITLKSKKPNPQLIYNHLNELTQKKFQQMFKKIEFTQSISPLNSSITKLTVNSVDSSHREDSSIIKIVNEQAQNKQQFDFDKENSYKQVVDQYKTLIDETASNHKNYNAFEIKIEVEKKPTTVEQKIINKNIGLILTSSVLNSDEDDVTINNYKINNNTTTTRKEIINDSDSDLITETDESFYQDKFIPQYMSNKNLKSPAIEYFKDTKNDVVYGKVKL